VGTLWHIPALQSAILTEDFHRLLLDEDEKVDSQSMARALRFSMTLLIELTIQWVGSLHSPGCVGPCSDGLNSLLSSIGRLLIFGIHNSMS
jgi:hypothetical protein